MAIDDNTVYGLYGSQVKELPGKINAVKGLAKVLTTADYNWPTTGTKTSVALWLLEPGVYTTDGNVTMRHNTGGTLDDKYSLFVVGEEKDSKIPVLITGTINAPSGVIMQYLRVNNDGLSWLSRNILDSTNIVASLTSTSDTNVLAASQGKALKDMIDAITGFSYEVVQTLPASGQNGKIYLVPIDESGGPSDNIYEEYIWVNNAWEMIGTTEMDLSNYVTFTDLSTELADYTPTSSLATVATSGSYNDLSNTPTVPSVVQATGTSTTDVMSQNAVTSTIFADPSTGKKVRIGNTVNMTLATDGVAIGTGVSGIGAYSTAIGPYSQANGNQSVAIGQGSSALHKGSVAIGDNARSSYVGEVTIGTNEPATGYNNSNYRLLTGLYDPQSAHDAATKGYVDTAISTLETELDAKQDVLTAGQNITIAEESGALVISATGGSGADVFTTNEWNALWA